MVSRESQVTSTKTQFIKGEVKMNKKTVGIVSATVIALILIVVAVFALKGKEHEKVDNTTNPIDSIENNNYEGIDVPGMSDRLGMTEDELKDVLDTELEGSAAQDYYDIQAELDNTPEIDHIVPDSMTDDGRYQIIDVNGDLYDVYDPFAAMTEEELAEYNKKMDEVFDAYENEDDDEANRVRVDAKDIMNQANYPEPDQDLIDAGFVATRDPNSDTGWSYENPNVVVNEEDRGTSQMPSYREVITDSSQISTNIANPYDGYDEVSIGYGKDTETDNNGTGTPNKYTPGGIKIEEN